MKPDKEEIARAERIIQQLLVSGVPEELILAQLDSFARGFPAAQLLRPCTLGDGVMAIAESEMADLLATYTEATRIGRVMKFVPASGAATRMFKSLSALANRRPPLDREGLEQGVAAGDEDCKAGKVFFASLERFAFHAELKKSLAAADLELETLCREGRYGEILAFLLQPKGLNYGNLPKGLITFHRYPEGNRTPLEEHLAEAVDYASDADGVARIHFTVSPEHLPAVEAHVHTAVTRYLEAGVRLEVSFSTQKSSSVTIAVDAHNEPFRTDSDLLVFRPAGHGALLSNLNDLQGDIVFIKNIDNVVPDHLKGDTYLYKRLLGGLLINLQDRIFAFLRAMAADEGDNAFFHELATFSRQWLNLPAPANFANKPREELKAHWLALLNRPLRVCGMVRNQGEPGGGPFWVLDGDDASVQIVEKAQIDLSIPDQQTAFAGATHFNPVDLVCGLRDYQGNSFHLPDYVNPDTGFVTAKSKDGVELKAMELPGLWNGSMAYWNTVFVEVPLTTFNPVKTVNDLLRPEHQP